MKVVLDTNVVVSGLLTPFGPSAEIMRLVSEGSFTLSYDPRILAEYREVLVRPKFGFRKADVDALLEQVESLGELVVGHPLAEPLPDRDDEMFLEVALAGNVRCLVTGNLKHYPAERRSRMPVVSPAQTLEIYRKERNR